ncbi:OmpA/MotB family protein [Desulfurobacterium sp.]
MRKKKQECKSFPAWLTSFGDLMSLLLTFFILLYSMSTISLEKFNQVIKGLTSAFGGEVIFQEGGIPGGRKAGVNFPKMYPKMRTREEVEKQIAEIHKLLQKNGMKASVAKYGTEIKIRINTSKLFPPGSAEPYKSAIPIIKEMCEKLKAVELPLRIEGYTDNVPIRTKLYPSNWELSAARAAAVLRLFIKCGYDPKLLSAAGYGPTHPIAPNNTPQGREKNRRIEIAVELPQ